MGLRDLLGLSTKHQGQHAAGKHSKGAAKKPKAAVRETQKGSGKKK